MAEHLVGVEGRREHDLLRRIAELEADLATCYRLSGADPDGNEDWRLAGRAVSEVRRLRDESDQADEENVWLRELLDRENTDD
jgi:hypothetical protein